MPCTCLLAACTFLLGAPPPGSLASPPVVTLASARFCPSLADTLPGPGDCAWTPVALAHLWRGDRGAPYGGGWYRLDWPMAAVPERETALYLRGMNRAARFWVNGRLVGTAGRFEAPLPMNWNRAQLVIVPPALLHAGTNEVVVQERAYGWERGWLAPVDAGDAAVLRPAFEWRRFWQNDLVMILGATTFLMSLFLLGVWLRRRDQALHFWLGWATLTWSAISLDYFAPLSPLPGYAWEQFIAVAQVLRTALLCTFILRFAGRRMPRLEAGMWAWWGMGAAVVVAVPHAGHWVDLWYLGTLVGSVGFFALLVGEAYRHRRSEAVALAFAAGTTLVLSGYDLWLFSLHTWTDRVYLAHFGAPLFLFVLGWVMMRRFVASLDAHQAMAAELEQRVQEKARALERNYEELSEARRNQALALERARIMSEMHDGIGSQLTLALSLVEHADARDRVAAVLRESVEDLQLIIDSLEPVENDLLTVLGTFRYRVQERLAHSGLVLRWDVQDLPPLPLLTPQNVLQVLRIVQEAFANCLKHAQASTLSLSTALERDDAGTEYACIRICDDGRGMTGDRVGRGLENMRRRAAAIGGRLAVVSRPGRTEVLLRLPTGR